MLAAKVLVPLAALTLGLYTSPTLASDERDWGLGCCTFVTAGISNTGIGTALWLQQEDSVLKDVAFGIHLGILPSYNYSGTNYSENGRAIGVEYLLRKYKRHYRYLGPYWGLSLGLWVSSYNYIDGGSPGSGSRLDISVNGIVGWKIRLGHSHTVLDPNYRLMWQSGLGYYSGIGIMLGKRI